MPLSSPVPVLDRPATILNVVHFDIVHGCGLQCVGCPNSTLLPKVRQLPLPEFDRCLRNIDSVTTIRLLCLFNFGDPLLHDDLPGVLRTVADQNWNVEVVEISTNAQFPRWDDLEAALETGVLGRLAVSCDGDGTPEEYERLRFPAKWRKLMHFLERAREIRDRVDPSLELITRTLVKSEDDAARWRSILEPLGWRPEFRGWKYLPDSVGNETGRRPEPRLGLCKFVQGNWQLYVDWDGTVVPCCVHPRAADFGNLRRQRLSEIMASPSRLEFTDRMLADRAALPICGRCEYGPFEDLGPSGGMLVPFLTMD